MASFIKKTKKKLFQSNVSKEQQQGQSRADQKSNPPAAKPFTPQVVHPGTVAGDKVDFDKGKATGDVYVNDIKLSRKEYNDYVNLKGGKGGVNTPNVKAALDIAGGVENRITQQNMQEQANLEAQKQLLQQEERQKIIEAEIGANLQPLGQNLPQANINLQPENPLAVGSAAPSAIGAGIAAGTTTGAVVSGFATPAIGIPVGIAAGLGVAAGTFLYKLSSEKKQKVSEEMVTFRGNKERVDMIINAANNGQIDPTTAVLEFNQAWSNMQAVQGDLKRKTDKLVEDFLGNPGDEYEAISQYLMNKQMYEQELRAAFINPKPRAVVTAGALG